MYGDYNDINGRFIFMGGELRHYSERIIPRRRSQSPSLDGACATDNARLSRRLSKLTADETDIEFSEIISYTCNNASIPL